MKTYIPCVHLYIVLQVFVFGKQTGKSHNWKEGRKQMSIKDFKGHCTGSIEK